MQRYDITGMSCAACASHVEKAVAAVPGVASVAVSLLTNSMQVDYTPDADPDATAKRIIKAVDAAGYGASLATAESENAELEDTETPKLKKRLIASLCFLVPLMYVSMGHMIGLPLGSVFHGGGWHAILFAGTQLALTLPVCCNLIRCSILVSLLLSNKRCIINCQRFLVFATFSSGHKYHLSHFQFYILSIALWFGNFHKL